MNRTQFNVSVRLYRKQGDARYREYVIKINVTEPIVKPKRVIVPPKPILVECTFLIMDVKRGGLLTLQVYSKNYTSNLTEELNPERDLRLTLST